MEFREDITACIVAVRKGYSPSFRHLPRIQRVSVGSLHEVFGEHNAERRNSEEEASEDGAVTLVHAETATHKGDIFTRALPLASFFPAVQRLGMRRACLLLPPRKGRLAAAGFRLAPGEGRACAWARQ